MTAHVIASGRTLLYHGDTVIGIRTVNDYLDPHRLVGIGWRIGPRLGTRPVTLTVPQPHGIDRRRALEQLVREHERTAWLLELRGEPCIVRAERIMSWLAELPDSTRHRDDERIVRVTRGEIAAIGGMSREQAGKVVAELVESRWLELLSGFRFVVPVGRTREAA